MENRKPMDKGMLFADETGAYRVPAEPMPNTEVCFRFRAAASDALRVFLLTPTNKKEMNQVSSDGARTFYETRIPVGAEAFSYVFVIEALNEEKQCVERVIYDKAGVREDETFADSQGCDEAAKEGIALPPESESPAGIFDVERAFYLCPGFTVPSWAKGAVMYQIFIDRFCNGDEKNDVVDNEYIYIGQPVKKAAWDSLPEKNDVLRFYGGDLIGLYEKLDYLKYLGVEAIYLNPVFLSPSTHKYDVQDYRYIDPHLVGFVEEPVLTDAPGTPSVELTPSAEVPGTLSADATDNAHATLYRSRILSQKNRENANAFFAKLVAAIHERGMRIILDGVFNHCASFHPWMNREKLYNETEDYVPGAYEKADSPYRKYFYFPADAGDESEDYRSWYDFSTLPKLNYKEGSGVAEEILAIAKMWLAAPYHIDGWRLDVAAELGENENENHAFWKAFRKAVKEVNPDAYIVAEHYGDPQAWLRGDEWDAVMNYDAFMDPVGYFLTGLEKHSQSYSAAFHGNGELFFRTIRDNYCAYPVSALQSSMCELSNHDHTRFLTRTNLKVGRLESKGSRAASEGLSYATFREGVVMQCTLPGAPTVYYGDEAGVTGWTDPDNRRTYPWGRENFPLMAFYKDTLWIHKRIEALRTGSFKPLTADYGYVSYGRFDATHSVLIAINHSDHARTIRERVTEIGMPENGTAKRILQTDEITYNVGEMPVPVKNGFLSATVPAWSATVFLN